MLCFLSYFSCYRPDCSVHSILYERLAYLWRQHLGFAFHEICLFTIMLAQNLDNVFAETIREKKQNRRRPQVDCGSRWCIVIDHWQSLKIPYTDFNSHYKLQFTILNSAYKLQFSFRLQSLMYNLQFTSFSLQSLK
jgi:hypothetical protein